MQKRFFIAFSLCMLILLFQDQAKSTLPALKWKIESITSGTMHGAFLDRPDTCVVPQFYIYEDPEHKGTVAQCRKPDPKGEAGWTEISEYNYKRFLVINKELGIPLEHIKITTASYFSCGCSVDLVWSDADLRNIQTTAIMLRHKDIVQDWVAEASRSGKIDKERKRLIIAAADNIRWNK